jgi:hypothetical protein
MDPEETAGKLREKSIDAVITLRIKTSFYSPKKSPRTVTELHSLTSSPSLPGRPSSTYEKELHFPICLF